MNLYTNKVNHDINHIKKSDTPYEYKLIRYKFNHNIGLFPVGHFTGFKQFVLRRKFYASPIFPKMQKKGFYMQMN